MRVTYSSAAGNDWVFEGHAWGAGVGSISSAGVIYYADNDELHRTHAFGVTFAADDGGVIHVTWGSHGNATAAGIGTGFGAFGGSGDWTA